MSEKNTRAKRMDLAFAALLSDDDAAALAAITRIEADGDARAIRPLLTALAKRPSAGVEQRITSLLYQLKAPDAASTLMTTLDEPALASVRQVALAAFWNAGLDVREHLERFIEIAITGDSQECFECLTIIENQELWPDKAARLALARVRKAIPAETDGYKRSMLEGIVAELERRLGVE